MVLSVSLVPNYKLTLYLLFIALFYYQSYAKNNQSFHGSLVFGMIHSRSLLSTSNRIHGLNYSRSEALLMGKNMVESLRGFRDGYLISLNIGTPPQIIQAFIDTGSDLTWFPCTDMFSSFTCIECDDYYLKNSKLITTTFSQIYSSSSLRDLCSSNFCTNIHSADNRYDPCAAAGCPLSSLLKGTCPRPCPSFSYNYGAGGLITGSLFKEKLRVHAEDDSSSGKENLSGLCFGCVNSAYREPVGIVGFGRGFLSFPSQLGFLQKGFSHCFLEFKYANNPDFSSLLILGELAIASKDYMQFTPMLKSPMFPSSYYIGLKGISIDGNSTSNKKIMEAPLSMKDFDEQGNGGMLIDSGTTYTHLPEPLYSKLLTELDSIISYSRSKEHEASTGFDLCYKIPCINNTYSSTSDNLPSISFHFLNNVDVVLPKDSCFYAVSAPMDSLGVKCLMFQSMDENELIGPAGVFGSFQQQNVEVVYDLQKERVGFQLMDCSSAAAYHELHH